MLTGGDNFPFPGQAVQGYTSEKIVDPKYMGVPLRDAMINELKTRAGIASVNFYKDYYLAFITSVLFKTS